jgi:hypothetical protein
LGFTFKFLSKILPQKIALIIIFAAAFIFTASNLYQTNKRFNELKSAPYEDVKVSADRILKEGNRVTLEQQYMVINYVESFYKENGYPIYLNSEPFYRRSLLFELDLKGIPRDDFRNVTSSKKVYQKGNYFLVYPTDSNLEKDIASYSGSYVFVNKKQFGTLTVIQLAPKAEAINEVEQKIEPKIGRTKSAPGVPERYTWEEIFNEDGENGEE